MTLHLPPEQPTATQHNTAGELTANAFPRLGGPSRDETERRVLEAQQRLAAARQSLDSGRLTERPGQRVDRARRVRRNRRLVAGVAIVTLVGVAAVNMMRRAQTDDADRLAAAVSEPDWPAFDEPLVEPASYRTTFRGPSYLSPSPWFEAERGSGSESIVVEIDHDGPGPSLANGLLVRREGSWHVDLQDGVVRSPTSSDGTTWVGFDDATRLRTFSAVTGGAIRDHLVLVDEFDDTGPGRRGAHGLHTYVFDFDSVGFCGVDSFSCESWFRSFGLSADDPGDTPLTGRMTFPPSPIAGAVGVRARPLARPLITPLEHLQHGRPTIQPEDTLPDRDAADGRLLLRLTVDDDGLLWDIELRRGEGRIFWISLDELSSEPFTPPVVLP